LVAIQPHLDSDLGTTLRPPASARYVAVDSPRLHAIDVVASDILEVLDLRDCGPGLHITVQGCPALRKIVPPDHGPGATIHIDFGLQRPRMLVHGWVADIDACWLDPQSGLEGGLRAPAGRKGRPPLWNAWIGRPEEQSSSYELLLYVGGLDPVIELPPDSAAKEVTAQDFPELTAVRMPGLKTVDAVQTIGCPKLAEVEGDWISELRVREPAEGFRVRGSGRHITLDRGVTAQVTRIQGRWESTHHRRPERRSWDTSSPLERGKLPRHAELGDTPEERAQSAVHFASQVTDRKTRLTVLEFLDQQGLAGCNLHVLWGCREILHSLGNGDPAEVKRTRRWTWVLPKDLGSRGWDADLRIWQRCAPRVEAAARYRKVLERAGEPEHLGTFARALWKQRIEPGATIDDALFEILRMALVRGRRKRQTREARRQRRHDMPSAHQLGELRTVIRALAGLASHSLCREVVFDFCAYVEQYFPCSDGVSLLKTLHMLGSRKARESLTVLSLDPRVNSEDQRTALLAALAPVKRPILSFEHQGDL